MSLGPTHSYDLQASEFGKSPCLADRERTIVIQLGFVEEPTPVIGLYNKSLEHDVGLGIRGRKHTGE